MIREGTTGNHNAARVTQRTVLGASVLPDLQETRNMRTDLAIITKRNNQVIASSNVDSERRLRKVDDPIFNELFLEHQLSSTINLVPVTSTLVAWRSSIPCRTILIIP